MEVHLSAHAGFSLAVSIRSYRLGANKSAFPQEEDVYPASVLFGVQRSCRNDGDSIPARYEDFPCPRRGLSS